MTHIQLTGKAVPTTDSAAKHYAPHLQDVAIYRGSKEISRYVTPNLREFKNRRHIVHNCFVYDFQFNPPIQP